MPNTFKPLKKGDPVRIKKWDASGTVVHVVPKSDNEEDSAYKVEVTHFFRHSDLELDDWKVLDETRKALLAEKTHNLEMAKKNLAGKDRASVEVMKYLTAVSELLPLLGYETELKPKK
jgi:hypothetical protein